MLELAGIAANVGGCAGVTDQQIGIKHHSSKLIVKGMYFGFLSRLPVMFGNFRQHLRVNVFSGCWKEINDGVT